MRTLLATLVLFAAQHATASTIDGFVSHVSDGDTISVRPAQGGRPHIVRIQGIDAPELCQPGGPEARDALTRRILQKRVHVTTEGQDDFGRLLGRVESQGSDVGAWLVRGGHAWSYRFRRSPGPYAREERMARQAHRGLWHDAHPMEPRAFRRWHGPCN